MTGLGFTYASPAAATVIEDSLRAAVIGVDAMDVPAAWRGMVDAVRNIGRPGVASSAISAVEVALWDLKAKLVDLSLADLLGRCHDDVAIYGSGGFTSYTEHELIEQLAGWVHDDHIGRVKMKVGTGWGRQPERDVQRVAAVRAAIGETA
ncbi:MAG: mandelate racemase, partial [Actinomycetota bacterium]|nr:mandelate racemase [Actinomycetota bacterium]